MSKDKTPYADFDALAPQPADPASQESLVSLLLRAREGSQEACGFLRNRYRPLIDASVAHFTAEGMTMQEKADLREEAERIFLTAISTYDTDQDAVDFGLYAKICLRNGLVSEVRSQSARHKLGIVSLETEDVSDEVDPARDLVEEERFHKLYQMIRSSLSAFENEVWWRFVSGVSVKRIAEQVGKDERSVHNAIYRIRRKLRTLLLDEDEND